VCVLSVTSPCSALHCFFFTAPPTTVIYSLSLHDALPIFLPLAREQVVLRDRDLLVLGVTVELHDLHPVQQRRRDRAARRLHRGRSEEHTSELQSQSNLVCRLLLEKKKTKKARARLDLYHN